MRGESARAKRNDHGCRRPRFKARRLRSECSCGGRAFCLFPRRRSTRLIVWAQSRARRLVRRTGEVQCSFWLWQRLAQLQLRTHEIHEDNYEDGRHQHFSNDSVSMTQGTKSNKGQPETHQRTNQTRILPLDPCRAMGASQPSPGIRIQKKRGCHAVLARRAFCPGAHPFRCLV